MDKDEVNQGKVSKKIIFQQENSYFNANTRPSCKTNVKENRI